MKIDFKCIDFYKHHSGYVYPNDYENKVNTWNADIHLISTYCFLSRETQKFASQDQVYLVKDVYEHKYENITGSKKIKVETNGMISSWMWYLQRNDVNLRNEWSNYSNWPYNNLPGNVTLADITPIDGTEETLEYGPGLHPTSKQNTGITITGDYKTANHKPILESMAILLNGEYRENLMVRGVYDYIEKYVRTNGNAKEGIYCYNFCLNTNPFTYQPSGAINMSKFKNIEIEITTYIPTIDPLNSNYNVICSEDGELIGIKKSNWQLYEYNYNLTLFEERQNVLSFIGGNCGMMYAR